MHNEFSIVKAHELSLHYSIALEVSQGGLERFWLDLETKGQGLALIVREWHVDLEGWQDVS